MARLFEIPAQPLVARLRRSKRLASREDVDCGAVDESGCGGPKSACRRAKYAVARSLASSGRLGVESVPLTTDDDSGLRQHFKTHSSSIDKNPCQSLLDNCDI